MIRIGEKEFLKYILKSMIQWGASSARDRLNCGLFEIGFRSTDHPDAILGQTFEIVGYCKRIGHIKRFCSNYFQKALYYLHSIYLKKNLPM